MTFSNMLEAYEALRSEEKGSRARTTKEGFLYHLLTFLQKQGLIDYVEEDEMINDKEAGQLYGLESVESKSFSESEEGIGGG